MVYPDALKYGCIEEYYDEREQMLGTKAVNLCEGYLKGRIEVQKAIINMPLFGYVWNTFYSVRLLNGCQCQFNTELRVNEDFDFNLRVFDNVNTLYFLDKCAYHYVKRVNNSLSTKKEDDYYKFHVFKIEEFLKYYKKWNLLDNLTYQKNYWRYNRIVYSSLCRKIEDAKAVLQNIFATDLYKEYTKISSDGLSCKKKILINELKNGHVVSIYLLCFLMNLVRNNMRLVFAWIKE